MLKRDEILQRAGEAVRDRENHYGSPEVNYERLALILNGVLGSKLRHPLSPADAIIIQLATKLARLAQSPDHEDTHVDIAGYAAILSEVA